MAASPRKRRRVVRRSDVDYDHSADGATVENSLDGARTVSLEGDESVPSARDIEFYREQQPPHYGG